MPIIYNEKTREFHLYNQEISYIIKILDNDQPGQLYYGKRLTHREDFSHLFEYAMRDMSPYAFEGNSTFSLENIKQEYPTFGCGDMRFPAYEIERENGSHVVEFVYKEHKIYNGKPKLEGLPATYVESDDEAQTLELVLEDTSINTRIVLLYTIYEAFPVIARSVRFECDSDEKITLLSAMSACVDLPDKDYVWMQFSGAWSRERHVKERRLEQGIQSVGSIRGNSSHEHNPFIVLRRPSATENAGEVMGFSLIYSGNHRMQAEVDTHDTTRITVGINPQNFDWKLDCGESFQTPEAVVVFSDQGLNGMSQAYHRLYRDRLMRGKWRNHARPILLNNWEATYFDFDEEKILNIAKKAKEVGVELFVLDDGWFGTRNDDYQGLGDWFVNEKKLCGTLSELVKEVHDMGLSFGLWFEPEMISEDSDLYRAHPDWALVIPGRQPIRSRSQLVLDMSREDVTDYLTERICDIVEKADIQYIKWDMNRSLMAAYSAKLPRDRQGELRHRYVLGLYKVLEAVTQRFPELLLEGCSGGGGRFDAGMLYYCPQIWCSDNTDAIERLRIQYGTSFGYPMSSVSAHVSVCPNHQNHRVTPFKTRGICAMQGTFGYELDLSKMTDEEKKMAGEQIAFFKEHGRLFQFGDYYRLTSPFENRDYTVWEYAAQDGSEACMSVVYTDMYANAASEIVKWKGLDPKKVYQMQLDGEDAGNFSGAALMHAGILLPLPEQNYDAFQIYLKAE